MNYLKTIAATTLRVMSRSGDGEGNEAPTPKPVENEGGGLPSANVEKKSFEEVLKERGFSEEMINDPEAFASKFEGYKNGFDKFNQERRNQPNEEKQQADLAAQQETIKSLSDKFIESGMEVTPEMEAEAKEKGIDIRDVKLTAIEVKASVEAAHAVVGGTEAYSEMIEGMREQMTEKQMKDFDKAVQGPMSEYAIKGLAADWNRLKADGKAPDRIRGDVPQQKGGVKGYSTQKEILSDLAYLRGRGKNDNAARQLHEKRKALTPDKIIYGG